MQVIYRNYALVLAAVIFAAAVVAAGALQAQAAAPSLQICVKSSGAAYIVGTGFKATDCSNLFHELTQTIALVFQ